MKRMLSGIKPTGRVTLGNYIGAIKPFVSYQDEYEMFIFVANLHSMTIYQDPKELRQNTKDLIALYIAAGLDPKKCTLFLQSDVLEHAQLGWYLGCMVNMGELSRMTQYKDKVSKGESIGAGIFNYPSLMNADILMYDPDYVPVGEDQKQHVELCRDIAERFNNIYSNTFKIPDPYISSTSSRIMNLQSPDKKMSKSDENESSYIKILDNESLIRRKISRSITDSIGTINYSNEQLGIKNLVNILSSITGEDTYDIVERFKNKGYGELKNEVSDALIDELIPIQNRVKELMDNKDYLESVYKNGADKAREASYRMLRKVKKKIGFI